MQLCKPPSRQQRNSLRSVEPQTITGASQLDSCSVIVVWVCHCQNIKIDRYHISSYFLYVDSFIRVSLHLFSCTFNFSRRLDCTQGHVGEWVPSKSVVWSIRISLLGSLMFWFLVMRSCDCSFLTRHGLTELTCLIDVDFNLINGANLMKFAQRT